MPRTFDEVARIAGVQHGRATTAQMLAAGVRPPAPTTPARAHGR